MSADGGCCATAKSSATTLLMPGRSAPPVTARALSATALYAVTFRPNADGRIATVQLRWEDPDTHHVTEINGNFNTWDLVTSFEQADPRYQLAVVVSQYAELLRHSPWATGTSASQLVEHAYRLSSLLWDDPEVVEFASLVSRASQIRALGN